MWKEIHITEKELISLDRNFYLWKGTDISGEEIISLERN